VVLNGFLRSGQSESIPTGVERLTSREREIVQLLAERKSNKQIAKLLQLSVKTVETHRAAVMRKLEVSSLAELVRFAVRNQLVQP
jgi:DNA-binding NarL/FixJ family response regulator